MNRILFFLLAGQLLFSSYASGTDYILKPDFSSDPTYQIHQETGLYLWDASGDISFQNGTMYINGGTSDGYSQEQGFILSSLTFGSNTTSIVDVKEFSADVKLLSNTQELLNSSVGINITRITEQADHIQMRLVLSNSSGENNGVLIAEIGNHNTDTQVITQLAYTTVATNLDLTRFHSLSIRIEDDTAYMKYNGIELPLPINFPDYGPVTKTDAYVWQWTYDDQDWAMKSVVKNVSVTFDLTIDGNDSGQNQFPTWYLDSDGDGYGDPDVSVNAALQPAGYAANNSDCDDANITVHPNATEMDGDGIDQDCDGYDSGDVPDTSVVPDPISIYSPADKSTLSFGSTSGKLSFSFGKMTGAAKYILHLELKDILAGASTNVPIELILPNGSGNDPWAGVGGSSTPGFSESILGMVFEMDLDMTTWDVLALYDVKWGVEAYNDKGMLIGSTFDGSAQVHAVNRLKFLATSAIALVSPILDAKLSKTDPAPTFMWENYQGSTTYTLILAHVGTLGFDGIIQEDNLTLNVLPMSDTAWQTMPEGTWYWTVLGFDGFGYQVPSDFTIYDFEVQ